MNVRQNSHAICVALTLLTSGVIYGQTNRPENEPGIPISDPLVIAKCGSCHPRDANGNMERISWQRTVPEGWQEEIRQMILRQGLSVTPAEARSLVRTLSRDLGLSPEEARPVSYDPERRIPEETTIPSERMRECARCHAFARALEWRRSAEEWKQFAIRHSQRYKTRSTDEALAFLIKAAPLHTPEWAAWSARSTAGDVTGDWLVTAHIPGRGDYYGKLRIDRATDGDFTTRTELTQVRGGPVLVRTGRGALFDGYAWRGRSGGENPRSAPDGESSDAREVMWFAPDRLHAEGRRFWGQYQEFEINVKLERPGSEARILLLDRSSLKAGIGFPTM
jgi:quinohemoprotein amine dehydrogenase